MARVSYVEEKDHPELAAEIAKIKGGRGGLINIYKLLLHSPTVADLVRVHRRDPLEDQAVPSPARNRHRADRQRGALRLCAAAARARHRRARRREP